jgi:glycosyltransferase involved in cell wall biosynthesis
VFEFHSSLDLPQNGNWQETEVSAPFVKSNSQIGERIRVVRIAHASLTPALRGRERALAKRFPQIDLEVITPPRWCETNVDVETVPDDLFPVRCAGTFFSKHIQLFAYDPFPIIEAFRRHKPHIIDMDHEPYSVPCAEIITLRNLFAPNTPIVMQTAQNILKKYPPPFSLLEKRALRQVSAAYMCSETVREVLEAKNFRNPTQIAYFGVDLEMFRPAEPDAERTFTIGYVGRLLPAKGVSVLIEALIKIKSEKWRLLVVGDGMERPALEQTLSEHGLLERCEFTGAVPYEKTPEYFQKLDVLVVPTITTNKIREQFGRVIIEAMACRVPVVGSTCGAIPEVIGNAGLVVPENDSAALAAQLQGLIRDENLRKKLARAGRRRVEENFTWERAAEQIFSLYQRVLKADYKNELA